ncbi:histidine phosphatase family protein [Aliifodinibius halophilus]|uniref:Histidine phosphatase family protein n=1 Tax=Fodinibius halophilus TaxID=1736908 RepID=A0A6M1T6E7_9BACT|nr:histidine phosphatase family protein [Fodinibius halophilus]
MNQIQGRGIDASLNDTGYRQARAIASHFKNNELHHLFSSSLKRSFETASVVGEMHGLEPEPHADLDEMDFGPLEGRPISEIESKLEELHNNWRSGNTTFTFGQAETPEVVLERASGRVEDILSEKRGKNLLFVLHGRLIRILVSHWLGYGLSGMHKVPHTNGALYHLQWNGDAFKPIYLNRTAHLSNGSASKV